MVRNGGRNGIALTLGFRWALPDKKIKDKKDNKNVNKDVKVKKIKGASKDSTIKKDVTAAPQQDEVKLNNSKKTVIKTQKQSPKAKNLAKFSELIGG